MARELTETKKQLAWSMWLGRRGSNETCLRETSKATRVPIYKLKTYLEARQKQQDIEAHKQRQKEIRSSYKKPQGADGRKKTKYPDHYTPPDDEELSRHSHALSVVAALNDARARRQRVEGKSPIHRRTQTDIMLEIRSRVDEILTMQGVKIVKKQPDGLAGAIKIIKESMNGA